jgi:hypothetical protein
MRDHFFMFPWEGLATHGDHWFILQFFGLNFALDAKPVA